MTGAFRRYLRILLTAALACLLAVAALNVIVDPFSAFRIIPHSPLGRYAAGMGMHIGKAEMINRADWDVLLLGTSRVQMGLDPQHPGFAGERVYNAGLYGADFPELDRAARLAMRKGKLKRLILCVDLYCFDPDWHPAPESQQSLLNPDLNRIDYWLSNLLSLNATEFSYQTLQNWRHGYQASNYPLGLRADADNPHPNHADWVLGGFFNLTVPPAAEASPGWSPSPSRLEALSKLLADASRAGVRVDPVQLPMHAICLERFFAVERWPVYRRWMAALTGIVDDHNRAFPNQPVRLWDFSTYNAYTMDPAFEHSHWFNDPFHFKPRLGDLVLDRLLHHPPPPGQSIDGFGEIVTGQNLQSHLQRLMSDHQTYFESNPEIQRIHQAIRADRFEHPIRSG